MKYFSFIALLLFAGCSWLQTHPAVVSDLEKMGEDVVKDSVQIATDAVAPGPLLPVK